MNNLKVYLVRHGEVGEGFISTPSSLLNQNGKNQIKSLAEEFIQNNIVFDHAYLSDLPRVQQSFDILTKNGVKINNDECTTALLRERNYSTLATDTSLTEDERKDLVLKSWQPPNEREVCDIYGTEAISETFYRGQRIIEELKNCKNSGNILIVSSGGFLMVLRCLLEGIDYQEYKRLYNEGQTDFQSKMLKRGEYVAINLEHKNEKAR